MSDTKKYNRPPRRGRTGLPAPRRMSSNLIKYTAQFPIGTGGVQAADSKGVLAGAAGFTIQFSTEYSALSSVFAECKLLGVVVIITPIYATSTVAQSQIIIGLNKGQNATTNSPPSSFSGVENLRGNVTVASAYPGRTTIKVNLTRVKNFLPLNGDCPTDPLSDSGSPGALLWYGTGFEASTNIFTMFYRCTWLLRSRI